jgi:hypothetical protein
MAAKIQRSGLTMAQILKRLQDSSITVGVHKDAGSYEGGESVVDVATYNEFGTPDIPERSFLRSTIGNNRAKYKGEFEKAYLEAIRGGMNLRAAAGFIGNVARDDIKKTIKDMKEPGNAPSTIAKKGFDDPLIETRKLWASIKWKYHYE